jgi:predicted nucleic acid-binding protein
MATKTEAYIDTSALIAFLDRSDSYHPLFRRLFSSPPRLVTSALVVAEGHGWFLRRYDRNRAIQFLNFIDVLSVLAIQRFDREELAKTSRLVKKFDDQALTLADAHGLVIIAERRISTCWSTDRHLGLTGAKLVISSPSP